MSRRLASTLLVSVVCALLVGCATGPTYSSLQTEFPRVASGQGRVFFYRNALYAGAVFKPDILIDGQRVGSAVPGGVFFVDLPPGAHSVFCDQQEIADMHLVAGETRYVSLDLYSGDWGLWHVRPILVDPDQGSQEILGLSYIHQ